LSFTRAEAEPIFQQAASLEEVLDAIDAVAVQPVTENIALTHSPVDKPQEPIN
jgi:hypothetical protein